MLKNIYSSALISFCLFNVMFGALFFSNIPEVKADGIQFKPQVTIGDFVEKKSYTITSSSIGQYINSIYKYAIGTVGILAVVVMMFGGILWVTAGGNQERIGSAKSWIGASLTGLVLTMASYTILNTINPDLVNFKPISPTKPAKILMGCCEPLGTDGQAYDTTSDKCDGSFNVGYKAMNGECYDQTTGCCLVKDSALSDWYGCFDDNITLLKCEAIVSNSIGQTATQEFHPGKKCHTGELNVKSCIP